jgi:hypothetical protein
MTDDLLTQFRSSVALPDEATAQRTYDRATSGRQRFQRRRLVVAVAGAVVCAAAAVIAVFSLLSSPSGPTSEPLQFSPIDLAFTRDAGEITSLEVTVNAATVGGTAELQVGRLDALQDASAGQVVFREQIPLTNVERPASGPPGDVIRSTWTGTLSPSEWSGGCQNAWYVITIKVTPAQPTVEASGEWAESGRFVCSSN